jgi:hypothetical protein
MALHDDWGDKFSPDGSALPVVSSDATHEAMRAGLPATAEQSAAILGNDAPSTPAPAPAVPVKSSGFSGLPDWGPSRDEAGKFVSKAEGEYRQQWENEGGLAAVAKIVTAKEQTMYSVAPSLEAKVTEHLDRDFLMKAADHLRLGVSYGPEGFWRSVAQFENALSPSVREAWGKFCRSLDADEQAALLYGMSK